MERVLHPVSCKIALFDNTRTKVLLVEYNRHALGLPGGHLEQDEEPEAAIKRELLEELDIQLNEPPARKDFWVHNEGKIVLGFVGELNPSTRLVKDGAEIRSIKWTNVQDIKDGKISAGTYDHFIIANSSLNKLV